MEEYEPLDVLCSRYKGLFSWLGGAENGQKWSEIPSLGTFLAIIPPAVIENFWIFFRSKFL